MAPFQNWPKLLYFKPECAQILFSIFSLVAILVGSRDQRTQFWKGAIQESFQQKAQNRKNGG
jgi:hypothetical protein